MEKKTKNKKEELKFLEERLIIRQKLFMEWAFVDNRLIENIEVFIKDTREIENRIIVLRQEKENGI